MSAYPVWCTDCYGCIHNTWPVKEQRHRIRDMINDVAGKHHIDEAIYKEDEK